MDIENAPAEKQQPAETNKLTWAPAVLVELDVEGTEGLGGGGPDFGSELS